MFPTQNNLRLDTFYTKRKEILTSSILFLSISSATLSVVELLYTGVESLTFSALNLLLASVTFFFYVKSSSFSITYIERSLIIVSTLGLFSIGYFGIAPMLHLLFCPLFIFAIFSEDNVKWRLSMSAAVLTCFIMVMCFFYESNSVEELKNLEVKSLGFFFLILEAVFVIHVTFNTTMFLISSSREANKFVRLSENDAKEQLLKTKKIHEELQINETQYKASKKASLEAVRENANIQAKLNAQHEELKQFAYAASHDLKEPLRTIKSFLQIAKKRLPDELIQETKLSEHFKEVDFYATNMHDMLEALLEYSRASRLEVELQPIKLRNAIGAALIEHKLHQFMPTQENIPQIAADPNVVKLIFNEVIGNAKKFADPNRPLELKVVVEEVQNKVQVQIIDNGIGVDAKSVRNVLDLFKRGDNHQISGAGIGLALVKKLMEKIDGEVKLINNHEHGVSVWLTFNSVGPELN